MTSVGIQGGAVASTQSNTEQNGWKDYAWLTCDISVEIPIKPFRLGQLLRLSPGTVISSTWEQDKDLPLRVNGEVIASVQFDVVGDKLAVRISELI